MIQTEPRLLHRCSNAGEVVPAVVMSYGAQRLSYLCSQMYFASGGRQTTCPHELQHVSEQALAIPCLAGVDQIRSLLRTLQRSTPQKA